MQRVSFQKATCPVARGLERVGEWWSMLIMRDALGGLTRFDEFQRSLNIAPNMLTRRLKALVEAGMLERRKYSQKPARYEYIVTQRGQDFRPVLWALATWGNKHFAPEGPSTVIVDRDTGKWAEPVLVDACNGQPMTAGRYMSAAGPAATKRTKSKFPFTSLKSGAPLKKNDELDASSVRYPEPADE